MSAHGTDFDDLRAALLWQQTTDDLVDWAKLRQATEGQEPLTERERCELLIRAVNGDKFAPSVWARLLGGPLSYAQGSGDIGMFQDNIEPLRATLALIAEDPKAAINVIGRNSGPIVNDNVIVLPSVKVANGRWSKSEKLIARSPGEALMFAVNLFLDPFRPFGKLLRQCQLRRCGRFAFGTAPTTRGQPPNHYCNDDHKLEHKLTQGRERAAAHRLGVDPETYRNRSAK